jgi:hypothetical protein
MKGVSPVKTFRAGAVRVSVFQNEQQADGRTFPVHRAVLERSYRDQDGNWHKSNGYVGLEIAKVILVMCMAFAYVMMAEHELTPSASTSGPPSPPGSGRPEQVREERISD